VAQLSKVVAVDLDGSLVRSDTLSESIVALLKRNPLKIFPVLKWIMHGKAALKNYVSSNAQIDYSLLPFRLDLLDYLKQLRSEGHRLVLCTGANERIAKRIAEYIGIFEDVIASDHLINNTGEQKRRALESKFGHRGYAYVGNSYADLPVWAGAREGIVVGSSPELIQQMKKKTQLHRTFEDKGSFLKDWMVAVRLHQWLKNFLVFVPLLAAHQATDFGLLISGLLAFLSFCFTASAVYIFNDLVDIENDRRHPRKYLRMFASGRLPISAGIIVTFFLIAVGLALSKLVGNLFLLLVILYLVLTTLYSTALKRIPLIDCITLAGLYSLRLVSGAVACGIVLSFWLLAFSAFLFLSLAFVKRFAELKALSQLDQAQPYGRGYHVNDLPLIQALGICSGFCSVLVLALYLNSDTVVRLYSRPELIWCTVPLLLLWVSWLWLQSHRGRMHDDPVIFAFSDRISQFLGVVMLLSFALAAIS